MNTNGNGSNGHKKPALPKVTRPREISAQQWVFILHYVKCWNGVESARKAGYKGNNNSLAVQASNLLSQPKIKAALDAQFRRLQLSADAALARLAEIANCNPADFMDVDGKIDLNALQEKGYLVSKVKTKVLEADGDTVTSIQEIDMHDALTALKTILQAHKIIGSGGDVYNFTIQFYSNFFTVMDEAMTRWVPAENRGQFMQFLKERMPSGASAN